MKRLILHGAMALLGLGLAWRASRPAESPSTETHERIFDCTPSRVTRLVWESGTERVEIVPDSDVANSYAMTYVTTPATGDPSTKRFRGMSAVASALGHLAPLEASRDLGDVSDSQLDGLGLGDGVSTLTVSCGDRTQTFHVGQTAYGSGTRYLRGGDGGHVYLVPSDPFRDLGQPEGRLMQRELHAFPTTDIDKVEVSAFGAQRTLSQRGRQNPRAAVWVDAAEPARVNELFGNWLRDVGRLRAQRYLGADEQPGQEPGEEPATVHPVVRLRYLGADGSELGHAELVRVPGMPERFFARSEATEEWVEVPASVGASIARDAASVVGAAGSSGTPTSAQPAPAAAGAPAPEAPTP